MEREKCERKLEKVTGWIARLAVVALGAAFSLAANAQGGRVLTKSDVIQIKVVSQPDMDTTTRIESDGTVNFPYVGRIKAAGLSEEQLAHAIERRLSERQIVTDPHVLVETTGFGAQASVQGQVGAPGVYTLDRTTTSGAGPCSGRRLKGERRNDYRPARRGRDTLLWQGFTQWKG